MVKKPFFVLSASLFFLFFSLISVLLASQLPSEVHFFDLFQTTENVSVLLIQNYTLPRIMMALLAGGILGLASLLLQQVLTNPLASDNTLGISAGAQFALFITAIFAPQWLEHGSSFIAVCGAVLSLVLVLTLAMRKTMSSLLLILAGLVINFYFGSFSALMMLFYPEEARGLALWGAGSLVQESWRNSLWLLIQFLPILVLIGILVRPLTILSLNDHNARSLGVPVGRLRLIVVLISSFLIAAVVSAVGMLGFIGLASTTLIRQVGIRTLKKQLVAVFGVGAMLLSLTDLCLQLLAYFKGINLPTGAVTALFGTPLLLWLMFRASPQSGRMQTQYLQNFRKITPPVMSIIIIGFIISILTALFAGSGYYGVSFAEIDSPWGRELITLRYPRVLSALSVGILLAIAGVLLQRLTLNPMASPELLGVSSGASMGILVALFCFSLYQTEYFAISCILGALITLFILILINQKSGMLPEKVLLTGISLSALFDTLQRIIVASGDLRANQLIAWTSGSTQAISSDFSVVFFIISLISLVISLLFSRWLELLVLQASMAQALGLNLKQVRWILILFSALLTSAATLVIGPLSFIGLLVPQIARFLGARKAHMELLLAAVLGGGVMVLADWLGRQILFPYEIPAGLMATLVGGTYFLFMVRRV